MKPPTETPLKGRSLPVILTGNPAAPFGHDERDIKIVPIPTDEERAAGLRQREDLKPGACPHKDNPDNCFLCGTKPIPSFPPTYGMQSDGGQRSEVFIPKSTPVTAIPVEPAQANAEKLVLVEPTPIRVADLTADEMRYLVRPSLPDGESYRKDFRLEFDTILKWFSQKILATKLKPDIAKQSRIAALEALIEEEKDAISCMSVRRQKRERPDDILPKADRETNKRHAKKNIETYRKEIHKLQVSMRSAPAKAFKALLDVDKVEDYKAAVYKKEAPDREFENDVIMKAIQFRLYSPPDALVNSWPVDQPVKTKEELVREQDLTENALILKTGGTAIGGGIRSAGRKPNGQAIPLKTFEQGGGFRSGGRPANTDGTFDELDSSDSFLD